MQIAILHGPRDLRIDDHLLETDNLGPRQIWTQARISALKIGADRGNFERAEQVPGAPDFPRWVGDGNLVIVRGIGREVDEFSVGDRVVHAGCRTRFSSTFVIPSSRAVSCCVISF